MRKLAAALLAGATVATAAMAQEPKPRLEAELGTSVEHLSNNLPAWRSNTVDFSSSGEYKRSYYGQLRSTERFSQKDSDVTVGAYLPFGQQWTAQLEAGASDTHRVLPRYSLLGQLDRRLDGGWGLQAGLRRSEYERSGTNLTIFGLDRYFRNYRAAYTLYSGRPDGGASGASHRLQWSWYYGEHNSLSLSAAHGREVESVFPAGLLTSTVSNRTLFGRHWFSPTWAVSYEASVQEQGDLYTRRGIRVGLRHAF